MIGVLPLERMDGVVLPALLALVGWIVMKLGSHSESIAKLTERQDNRDQVCAERMDALRDIDSKVSSTAEKVAQMHGQMIGTEEPETVI